MPSQVWKFKVQPGSNIIEVPQEHVFLSIQPQGDGDSIWLMVNPESPVISRGVNLVGTGQNFSAPSNAYLGTVQQGPFVWHAFGLLYK